MLSCDEAAMICDKNQYGEASFWDKFKLRVHILACKMCKEYTKQNSLLTKAFKKKANELKEHYKTVFLEQDQTPCPLFSHAESTLGFLSERARLAVATGKARRGLERAFDASTTRHFFEHSRCADEAESKPSSDMLLQIISEWQVSPEQVLMVGDTIYDMQMAENIGMPRVAVSYGVHHPDALSTHKPLRIIDCFSELQDFV